MDIEEGGGGGKACNSTFRYYSLGRLFLRQSVLLCAYFNLFLRRFSSMYRGVYDKTSFSRINK